MTLIYDHVVSSLNKSLQDVSIRYLNPDYYLFIFAAHRSIKVKRRLTAKRDDAWGWSTISVLLHHVAGEMSLYRNVCIQKGKQAVKTETETRDLQLYHRQSWDQLESIL